MRRRDLFRLGAVAAVSSACGGGSHTSGGSIPPAAGGGHALPHAEVEELPIAELQRRMASGAETSTSLLAKYRARIEAANVVGPELRAVIELDPDAAAMAASLDAERKAGKVRGPLHGIPMLVKDNLDTAGKMPTTAGSMALAGTHAATDATVVAKLRAAGALIVGKTNLSEWANIRGQHSSSGWSAIGGQCRNPYALDRSPSGSSSGSAAATTANLCAAAIGTETDGSITSPSSVCCLVGVKPTVGLVSRAGIIPISASQDTAGPMARTVADAALILNAIAGPDPRDPATASAKAEDYTSYLKADALRGARLGVPRKGWFGTNRNADALAEAALLVLTRLGAVIVDVELPEPPELEGGENAVLLYELKAGMTTYLATRGGETHVRTLEDIIAFNKAHASEELALFGQEQFEAANGKGALTEKEYTEARALCIKLARTDGIDKTMDDNKLDAIIGITNGPAWLIDPVNGDSFAPPYAGTLPAVAGYPHVTVPAGFSHGLPMGLSFIGRPYTEGKLLGLAFAFEQETHHRRAPAFLPSAPRS
jgi:amidase